MSMLNKSLTDTNETKTRMVGLSVSKTFSCYFVSLLSHEENQQVKHEDKDNDQREVSKNKTEKKRKRGKRC